MATVITPRLPSPPLAILPRLAGGPLVTWCVMRDRGQAGAGLDWPAARLPLQPRSHNRPSVRWPRRCQAGWSGQPALQYCTATTACLYTAQYSGQTCVQYRQGGALLPILPAVLAGGGYIHCSAALVRTAAPTPPSTTPLLSAHLQRKATSDQTLLNIYLVT